MKQYALIEDGTVREIIKRADDFDITKAYHSNLVWVAITGVIPVPQERWLYDGTNFTVPPGVPFDELKNAKRAEFTSEGVTRIAAQVPDWDSLDAIKTVAGLWASHLAANATAAQLKAKNIYLYVRNTMPPKLAAVSTEAELDAIDPSAADPFGDGTPWPT